MCVSRCLRRLLARLVATAMVCMLSNILLLLPDLKIHFLLEGHVTREATWATGLWGSGLLVLFAARAFLQSSETRGCCAFRCQMCSRLLFSFVCLLSGGVLLSGESDRSVPGSSLSLPRLLWTHPCPG
ncbi:transmembrane 4 L6 family member 1-like [Perca fluviatilis]|uniref:transmembrane 4 L6 family member 1-like n=1 Tax=Perca fluviatilis TaxID=8168 RepID=UPI0019660C55|nr:transmembrane 4 L6 family member 1-like [Perca fluviatilis]